MGLTEIKKGKILHSKDDVVHTIEIVLKGSVRMYDEFDSLNIGIGGIIGIVEKNGANYKYDYQANDDVTIYSYEYKNENSVQDAILSNPKIAPVLASQMVQVACNGYVYLKKKYDLATKEYKDLQTNQSNYPGLCALTGEPNRTFLELYNVEKLEKSEIIGSWQADFIISVYKNDEKIRKGFYSIGTEMCCGVIMGTVSIFEKILNEIKYLTEYSNNFAKSTASFKSVYAQVKAKADQLKRDSAVEEENVKIENALDTILEFSNVESGLRINFKKAIETYMKSPNRTDASDEMRMIRRDISKYFYEVYLTAFKTSLTTEILPTELKMFFMFGFVDEKLAGEENTAILYKFAKNYEPDENGRIKTIYEWLKMIYDGEVEPSRNEFDLDYVGFLKEQKAHGEITEAELKEKMNDSEEKLKFEVKNLFTLGSRMTFGRISVFLPIFDSENVQKTLETTYMSKDVVNSLINEIKKIDYSLFYRETVFSDTSKGITQLYVQKEVMPYVILLPNIGSRMSLWQEIEGRRRATPARFLTSIFHTENMFDNLLKTCGEYRWEMCKTVQGAYWNNIKDPSLTSEYCDYLQFYKKNNQLSTEQKEKLKIQLKKYSNNFRNVFVADYMTYMKFEEKGSLRLNKIARAILATYCTFSAETRTRLKENPQYKELITKHDNKIQNQLGLIANLVKKLNNQKDEIPEEVTMQEEFLNL